MQPELNQPADRFRLLRQTDHNSRRQFQAAAGGTTLSLGGLAILGGCTSYPASASDNDTAQDILIQNAAIATEHEAVAAYQIGAESDLLEQAVLSVAVQFQSHHKEHVDALSDAVNQLGGSPATAKDSYAFPLDQLKQQFDALQFAAGLERAAVSAYAGAIPVFDNRDLAAAAASILADEAMHCAVLRNALGLDPVPGAFFS